MPEWHIGLAEIQLHLFITFSLDRGEWSSYAPAPFPGKEAWFTLNGKLVENQSWS